MTNGKKRVCSSAGEAIETSAHWPDEAQRRGECMWGGTGLGPLSGTWGGKGAKAMESETWGQELHLLLTDGVTVGRFNFFESQFIYWKINRSPSLTSV